MAIFLLKVGTSALSAVLDDLPGNTKPVGPWDPLELATLGSDSTLAWFRASELKVRRLGLGSLSGCMQVTLPEFFPLP